MNNYNLDRYLDIVNEEKNKKGLTTYVPLYPMLRVENNKIYVAVMLTKEKDNVWTIGGNVKAKYWVLIDSETNKIIEFNNTSEKDFVLGDLIKKDSDNKQKEITKYCVKKTIEYKEYLLNDIKNDQLPLQKKLADSLNNVFEIDGDMVNINDYLISNLEADIQKQIEELVNILMQFKYSSLTFYYDQLFSSILSEFKDKGIINKDKIKLCIEIMNNYYDGVIAIDNMFNIL